MNRLTVHMQKQTGRITGFECAGHTGYGEEGTDIVCAAVSAIVGAAVIGIQSVAKVDPSVSSEEALLKCELPEGLQELQELQVETILRTMLLGVRSIQRQYPEHVSIKTQEA